MALRIFTARNAVKASADRFEKRIGSLAIDVAGRFSRGNAAIQNGRILTADRLEGERDALTRKFRKS